jgi:hypothetical protein
MEKNGSEGLGNFQAGFDTVCPEAVPSAEGLFY